MANYCWSCGTPLEDGPFCRKCGQKNEPIPPSIATQPLQEPPIPSSEPVQHLPDAPTPPEPVISAPTEQVPIPETDAFILPSTSSPGTNVFITPNTPMSETPPPPSMGTGSSNPSPEIAPSVLNSYAPPPGMAPPAPGPYAPPPGMAPPAPGSYAPPIPKINPMTTLRNLSLPVKISSSIGALLIIAFAILYSLFGGQTPEGQLEKFNKAVELQDISKLSELVISDIPVDEVNLKKYMEYLRDNPHDLEKYTDKTLAKKLIRASGKKLFIFDQYRVALPTVELSVDTVSKAVIYVDGKEVLKNTQNGRNGIGKFLPGRYNLQVKATYPFGEFASNEETVELDANPGENELRSVSLSFNALTAQLTTKSFMKNANVTINGNEFLSGANFSDRKGSLNPLPNTPGLNVKITSNFPFGDYTESFATRQQSAGSTYAVQSVPTAADNKALLDSIAKNIAQFAEGMTSGLKTGDLTNLKNAIDTSNEQNNQLVRELEELTKSKKQLNQSYEAQYLGLTLDVSTLTINKDEMITIAAKVNYHNAFWKPAGTTIDQNSSTIAIVNLKNINGSLKIHSSQTLSPESFTGTDLVNYPK